LAIASGKATPSRPDRPPTGPVVARPAPLTPAATDPRCPGSFPIRFGSQQGAKFSAIHVDILENFHGKSDSYHLASVNGHGRDSTIRVLVPSAEESSALSDGDTLHADKFGRIHSNPFTETTTPPNPMTRDPAPQPGGD